MRDAYRYQWQPKLVINDGFDYGRDILTASIADDPDVLRKVAGSPVVSMWGDFAPIPGYSIVHLISHGATEVTGANRNGDGFKAAFCRSSHPTFLKHGALYRHHINRDYSKRDGDILRSAYNDDMGRVELAVAASHEKCADWLSRLERGEKVAFSMGFDCKYDICSICGNKAPTRKDYCEHVKKNASYPYGMNRVLEDGRRCYVDNPEGVWNDISFVGTGADMIAQDLRKIAGLDDSEAIGGAELAAQYFGDPVAHSVKVAIAHKVSRMEKQVPALSYKDNRTNKLSQKTAEALRSVEPSRMFNELAQCGAVLGLRDFYKLACGDLYTDEFDTVVRSIEPHAQQLFSRVTEDPAWLEEVCTNGRYNANKTAARVLSDWDRNEVVDEFSINPDLAEKRALKCAMYGEDFSLAIKPAPANDPRVRAVLGEYAAYKLAALDALPVEITDELAVAAVLTT